MKGRRIFIPIVVAAVIAAVICMKSCDGKNDSTKVTLDEVAGELSFGGYTSDYWESYFLPYHKTYLNGSILIDIAGELGISEVIDITSAGRRDVDRAEWNEVYDRILSILDMKGEIEQRQILVVDIISFDTSPDIITNIGEYTYDSSLPAFETWHSYDVYVKGDTLVGYIDETDDECSIENVYLLPEERAIDFLFSGGTYTYETDEGTSLRDGVCDLVFMDGSLISVRTKSDTISGNLMAYDSDTIEIDEYGRLPHAGRLPVYELWGDAVERSISDVVLGNMEVEYVTGDGKVCAILITKPASLENVRVLLLSDEGTVYRDSVYLSSSCDITLKYGVNEENFSPGDVINIALYDDKTRGSTLVFDTYSEDGEIYFCDSDGNKTGNGYMGTMEVRRYDEGYTVINQIGIEDYLTAVVPSEMPSSYEPEALKAQAICARSYACINLIKADYAYLGAHMTDGTSYQVYNKVAPTDASIRAVYETAGQVIAYEGEIVEAYYFSTSMGYTDTAEIWNTSDAASYGYLQKVCLNYTDTALDLSDEEDFLTYISQPNDGYDSGIKFYRWSVYCDFSEVSGDIISFLESRYKATSDSIVPSADFENLGKLKSISVKERSGSGSVLTLLLDFDGGEVSVKNEYNIRKIMGFGAETIVWADATGSDDMTILPSSYFHIQKQDDGTYMVRGGGYGHGIGMSQNGANGMAQSGMKCEEILQYFYKNITIQSM